MDDRKKKVRKWKGQFNSFNLDKRNLESFENKEDGLLIRVRVRMSFSSRGYRQLY